MSKIVLFAFTVLSVAAASTTGPPEPSADTAAAANAAAEIAADAASAAAKKPNNETHVYRNAASQSGVASFPSGYVGLVQLQPSQTVGQLGQIAPAYYSTPSAVQTPVYGHAYAAAASPLLRPSSPYSSAYAYPSAAYGYAPAAYAYRGGSLPYAATSLVDAKTVGHLRPQFYQTAQPQFYALPAQTLSSPAGGYPSLAPTSAYYSTSGGGYGGHRYYKAGVQPAAEPSAPSPPQAPSAATGYRTQYVFEKPMVAVPETVTRVPVVSIVDQQQMSNALPRDAAAAADLNYATPWNDGANLAYAALPPSTGFSPVDELRRRDVVVDDKFDMRIRPSYLMDRVHLQPEQWPWTTAAVGRSAAVVETHPVDGERMAAVDPTPGIGTDDNVYVVMNPYDSRLVAKAIAGDDTASAAWATSTSGGGGGGGIPAASFQSSLWSPTTLADASTLVVDPNSAAGAPLNGNARDGRVNAPFSHVNINDVMRQFYQNELRMQLEQISQQMANDGKRQSPSAGYGRNADEDERFASLLLKETLKKFADLGRNAQMTDITKQIKSEKLVNTSTTEKSISA